MQAVAMKDEKPVLELATDEFVFSVTTPDERYKVLFHMKPYRSATVRAFYNDLMVRRKTINRDERAVELPDQTRVKAFIDAHFIRISGGIRCADGSEPDIEMQRLWLQLNDGMKLRVWRQGYDNIGSPDYAAANGNGHLELFGPPEVAVEAQWKLWDGAEDRKLVITHHMGRLNKLEHDRYSKSIRLIETGRETYIEANWEVVEQYYDQKVRRLEGAVLDGADCTETNKAQWVRLVPFSMKVFAMGQMSSELETKNV